MKNFLFGASLTLAFFAVGCKPTPTNTNVNINLNSNANTNANSNAANAVNTNVHSNANADANAANANANANANGNLNANGSANANTAANVPVYSDAAAAVADGKKFFEQDQNDQALEALKQAVKMSPDLAEAHFQTGVIYNIQEKPEDANKAFAAAAKAYQKFLVKNPKDAGAYFQMGRALGEVGKDDDAVKALRKAIALQPKDSEYQYELGAAYNRLAKYQEAVGALTQALKLDPDNSRAEVELERAKEGRKRVEFGKEKNKEKAKS